MNLLAFNIPDGIWVAFSLLVLLLILRRVLWGPVNRILDERRDKVVKAGQDAAETARLRVEAEQLRARLDAEMEARTAELMQEARSRAGQEYDRIVADADKKAQLILSAAKTKAEQERERLELQLKKQMGAAAIEAAAVLLRANMDGANNQRLIEAFFAQKDVSA